MAYVNWLEKKWRKVHKRRKRAENSVQGVLSVVLLLTLPANKLTQSHLGFRVDAAYQRLNFNFCSIFY